MNYCVYGLADPATPDAVRYVGFTNNQGRRRDEHVRRNLRGSPEKRAWIAGLLEAGSAPVFVLLADGLTKRLARECEFFQIKARRAVGQCDLNAPVRAPLSLRDELLDKSPWDEDLMVRLARLVA